MKLQDYLKENVKNNPDGLFLLSGEKSYTYNQFYLVEFVSALPKDASGKVNKISLRMLDKN